MSQHSVCFTHCVLMREGSGGGGMSPVFWGAYPCYASLCRSCTIGYSRLCRKYCKLHKMSPVFCVLGAPRPASAEARVQHKVPYVAQENTPIQGRCRLSIVAQEMKAHTCTPCPAMCNCAWRADLVSSCLDNRGRWWSW